MFRSAGRANRPITSQIRRQRRVRRDRAGANIQLIQSIAWISALLQCECSLTQLGETTESHRLGLNLGSGFMAGIQTAGLVMPDHPVLYGTTLAISLAGSVAAFSPGTLSVPVAQVEYALGL